MSRTIIYDKRFLKTTRGVIPMVLIGSSNCYETRFDINGRAREVRERYWSVINDMMLEDANGQAEWLSLVSEKTDGEIFQEKGKWILGKDIKKWFSGCVKHAKSLEEYLRWNPRQSFVCQFVWYEDKESSLRKAEFLRYCHNTAELEAWIDKARALKRALLQDKPNATVYFQIGFDGNEKLNAVPEITGQVVAKHGKSYVCAYEHGRSRSFTLDPAKAYIFPDLDTAVKELGVIQGEYGPWHKLTFVSADTVRKGTPWVIMVGGSSAYAGRYIKRFTSGHVYFTLDAKSAHGYSTKYIAQQTARKIAWKFKIGTTKFVIRNTADGSEIMYDIEEEKKA